MADLIALLPGSAGTSLLSESGRIPCCPPGLGSVAGTERYL